MAPSTPSLIVKRSPVVAIGVGRGGVGRDNGTCWHLGLETHSHPTRVEQFGSSSGS